jgi:ABC-type Zn uptake system ZnuABC Zn-binding protein ZnuA
MSSHARLSRFAAVCLPLCLLACLLLGRPAAAESGTVVAVTLPDVGLIVSAVAGDLARVTCLTPGGADPHSFTLSAADIEHLRDADLVVFASTPMLEFEADLRASLSGGGPGPQVLDWPDYEKHGARLNDVPGLPRNPHGLWMDPGNAQAMAAAVAERLTALGLRRDVVQANLARFRQELQGARAAARLLANRDGPPRPLVAVVPGVADVILASARPVAMVLLPTEGASFASASDVSRAVEKLRSGEWGGLVCAEVARDSKPGEIARQIATDSGSTVYYVRFIPVPEPGWTYVAQTAYNSAVLAGGAAGRGGAEGRLDESALTPGLAAALVGLPALVVIIGLALALVGARRAALAALPGAGIFGNDTCGRGPRDGD